MGILTEAGLDDLVRAGCSGCGKNVLQFRAFLDARILTLGGEPVSKLTWVYDGEKFVDGVFEVTCAGCKKVLLAADLCPRCHAPGGLTTALESENRFPRLKECPQCQHEELRYFAMLPATVSYEQGRAGKPVTHIDAYDPGFHGLRIECRDCGPIAKVTAGCPLCAAPGPLRARPG